MRRFAVRRNLVDVPNARSSHVSPTPRGGGVSIVAAFLSATLLLFAIHLLDLKTTFAVMVGGGAIAGVGFLDDRRHLPARLRFVVHVAAAVLVVAVLGGIPEHSLAAWGIRQSWIGFVLSLLVLVWATNLFNFMDGIDGIAGSESVFVGLAGAWFNWMQGGDPGLTAAMLCLATASAGFLVWNWPPARIFMGDVGSGFLGFMLSTLALAASRQGRIPFEVWPILGGVFVVDSTVTLVRRLIRGDRWYEPHRIHAYQHLARRLRSHRQVTLIVIAMDAFWLMPWAWLADAFPARAGACALASLSPLVLLALWVGAGKPER
jgi:Fuc2NAc and GlcNAc transferase